MSAPPQIPPQELRPLLHQKIDSLADEDLADVHRRLLELEAQRLTAELGREFADDWATGRLSEESIASAIREHRAAHPYHS